MLFLNVMLAKPITVAFLDRHRDVHGLTGPFLNERDVKSVVPGVVDIGLGILHKHLEIAEVLVLSANALRVFVQLGRVVRLGK